MMPKEKQALSIFLSEVIVSGLRIAVIRAAGNIKAAIIPAIYSTVSIVVTSNLL